MSKLKAAISLLTEFHANLGVVLESINGGKQPPSADDTEPAVPEALEEMELPDLKELAKQMDLGTPKSIGRMKREKVLSLFEGVSAEDIAAQLADDEDGNDAEATKAVMDEYESSKEEWRDLAKHLGALPENARPRSIEKIQAAILEHSSAEEVQAAIEELWDVGDGDDDGEPEDDSEAIVELLTTQEFSVTELRSIAVDLKAMKKKDAEAVRSKKLITAISENCTLEEVQEVVDAANAAAEGDDDDSEEVAELLSGLKPTELRTLALSVGVASKKKLTSITRKKDLIALLEDVDLSTLQDALTADETPPAKTKPKPKPGAKAKVKPGKARRRVKDNDNDAKWS